MDTIVSPSLSCGPHVGKVTAVQVHVRCCVKVTAVQVTCSMLGEGDSRTSYMLDAV